MNMQNDRQNFDRITEQDGFDAAEVFLACILADNSVMNDCGLVEDDFTESVHRIAFRECERHSQAGHIFSAILIKPALPKVFSRDPKSPLYEVSPADYINKLMLLVTCH